MNILPIAAALISGIYSSPYLPVFPAVLAGIVFIAVCVFRICRGKKEALDSAFFICVFVLGIFLYHNGMKLNIGHINDYVTVRGIVAELPYENYGMNRYAVYCNELEFNGELTEPKVRIIVNSDKPFNCGDSVSVHGKLTELSDDERSYGFDTRRSYASRGITAKMNAREMKAADKKYTYHSASYYSCIMRSKAASLIRRHYGGDIAAAMIAIITGDRHQFSEEYNNILIRTAMRRLYYPVFAHITLIFLIIGLFTHIIPKRFRDFSILLVLLIYTFINSANAVSVKAAAAAVILILSKMLTGSGNRINSLAIYIVISLLINPMLLYRAEYVISIGLTLLYGQFVPVFSPKPGLKRKLVRFLIATVGIMPIGAALFSNMGIYGYFASIVFIPVVMLILILSPFFLINCTFASPEPVGWLVHKLVLTLLHIPIWVDKLPFSSISLPKPTFSFISGFYFAAAAIWYFRKRMVVKCRVCTAVACGFTAVFLISELGTADRLRLDFIVLLVIWVTFCCHCDILII